MSDPSENRVAVVAIGRNEGERLEHCLRAARAICPQVVYADSMSTDGSVEIARSLGAITIQLDDSAPHTAARGRNAGFREVLERFPGCEFVQFIDGDCILEPGWLESATDFLDAHPKAAVACGRRIEAHPESSLYNRMIDEEWNTPVGKVDHSGGDALVRVSAFDQVGGFRAELKAGEEPEMTTRLRAAGWEIWRIDAPMTIHDARMFKFAQWWKRSLRGGYGYAQVWSTTGQLPCRVFADQLRRAFLWTLGVPLIGCLLAVLFNEPLLLLTIPMVYVAQVVRIAARRGLSVRALQSAAMIQFAKLPEAVGALSYFLGKQSSRLADYKTAPQ